MLLLRPHVQYSGFAGFYWSFCFPFVSIPPTALLFLTRHLTAALKSFHLPVLNLISRMFELQFVNFALQPP